MAFLNSRSQGSALIEPGDISDFYQPKLEVLRMYASQFSKTAEEFWGVAAWNERLLVRAGI